MPITSALHVDPLMIQRVRLESVPKVSHGNCVNDEFIWWVVVVTPYVQYRHGSGAYHRGIASRSLDDDCCIFHNGSSSKLPTCGTGTGRVPTAAALRAIPLNVVACGDEFLQW